jgi:hypothetical protein
MVVPDKKTKKCWNIFKNIGANVWGKCWIQHFFKQNVVSEKC